MLKYNLARILKARGIDRPGAYLIKEGFSATFANRIRDNRVNRLNPAELEKLCLTLYCTPDDLMEWTPDTKGNNYKDHPMMKLKRSGEDVALTETLSGIPLDQMEKIHSLIKQEIGRNEEKKEPE